MTWETIPLRGNGISVSWRKPGGQGAKLQLALTLSSGVCAAAGFTRDGWVFVQRDRMGGKLRLAVATEATDGARKLVWKASKNSVCGQIFIPLKDVQQTLLEPKPAQTCRYDVQQGEVVIRLPPWACPPVVVSVGRAA